MVKKSIIVRLPESESHSSAAKGFFESRFVVWSIVEAVKLSLEELPPPEEPEVSEEWPTDLPLAFGATRSNNDHSSASKKKKRKKRKLSHNSSDDNGLWHHYQKCFKRSHRIQEENIFYVSSSLWNQTESNHTAESTSSESHYHLVEVRGVHSMASKDFPEDILVIRFLHSQQYSLLYRSQLIQIS